eukprot:1140673-Pelagomonas_calceolata.AAC.2
MYENKDLQSPERLQQVEIGGLLSPSEEPPQLRSGSSRRQESIMLSSNSRLSTAKDEKSPLQELCVRLDLMDFCTAAFLISVRDGVSCKTQILT